MAQNLTGTQKFAIGAIGVVVASAVFVTGVVALAIGVVALPIYIAFKKARAEKPTEASTEIKQTAIDAEFKRID